MTPQEKAIETRKRNKALAEQKRKAEREERELIRQSLKEVLASENATPAEKLESSRLLIELDKRTGY